MAFTYQLIYLAIKTFLNPNIPYLCIKNGIQNTWYLLSDWHGPRRQQGISSLQDKLTKDAQLWIIYTPVPRGSIY